MIQVLQSTTQNQFDGPTRQLCKLSSSILVPEIPGDQASLRSARKHHAIRVTRRRTNSVHSDETQSSTKAH